MLLSLAARVLETKPSDTLILSAIANQRKKEGHPVINLTVGEPDAVTPEFIRTAVIQALKDAHYTKYTAVDGMPALKAAIIQKFQRDNQLTYEPHQVIVSTGAKQAIYNLMQALLSPGEEVLIPAPYWVSYPSMVSLASAVAVSIPATIEQGFKITPTQLDAAITPRTKALILNSPTNPTGIVYSPEELRALGEVLLSYPKLVIISDDIYESIFWSKIPFANIVQVCPALYNRTVVINGVSKAYAMTGWRIGYAAGPAELIQAMVTVQSQSTSCPNALAQFAAQIALTGDSSSVAQMSRTYQKRHQLMLSGLSQIPGIRCLPAQGAFYSFPCVKEVLARMKFPTDEALAHYLLTQANLAVVPGTGFGAPGHLRLSFALESAELKTALERLKKALER